MPMPVVNVLDERLRASLAPAVRGPAPLTGLE